MAATINVEHKDEVRRQDTFRVNPNDIVPGRNARNPDGQSEAVDYADRVQRRALSFVLEGQLQPVGVRRGEKNELIQTFGFTRRDAALLLRKGFEAVDPRDGQTRTFHDPNFLLWVKVEDCSADEAFLRSIKENLERDDITDYQEAKQHQELRTTMGWTDAQIARFYGYTNQNRVATLERLLCLPEKYQKMVHEKKLALYAAVETTKIADPAERERILDGALTADGKIDGKIVKDLLRQKVAETAEKVLDAAEAEGEIIRVEDEVPKKGKKKAAAEPNIKRNASDMKKFAAEVCDETTVAKPKVKALFEAIAQWLDGKCQDKTLWNRVNDF